MAIKDIIELESKGFSVPVAVAPKPTTQEIDRTRGKFVPGRNLPSKQIRTAHRRAKTDKSLKQWAADSFYNSAAVVQWRDNKRDG